MSDSSLVFAYGTLTMPEILVSLLGEEPSNDWATMRGYRRCRVDPSIRRQAKGPLARKAPGEELRGRLLALSRYQMEIVEAFEASAPGYTHAVEPVMLDSGATNSAIIYVADTELQPLLVGVWDPEEFREKWLTMYLEERIPTFLRSHGFTND